MHKLSPLALFNAAMLADIAAARGELYDPFALQPVNFPPTPKQARALHAAITSNYKHSDSERTD